MPDCEFCAIAAGDAPATVLYEDRETIAFLDADPAVAGHALVVPKTHCEELLTADETLTTAVSGAVRTVALAMEEALDVDGFSAFHTSGVLVGHVTHAHVHLLPRDADDDVHLALDRAPVPDDVAEAVAARIRAAI